MRSKSSINQPQTIEMLKKLVSINSVNPSLVPGGAGEREISEFIAEFMRESGLETQVTEVSPGRTNVTGLLKGDVGKPKLLLNGHMDTVGVEHMEISPFDPVIREGKLFGRGSYDMKGGLAAILAAVKAVVDSEIRLKGDLIVAAVCDEEYGSIGTEKLMENLKPDGAIVGEATGLQILVAHKGFAWIEFETHGVAAHGSLPEIGVDAVAKMGKVLVGIERLEEELKRKRHPLVGSPSVHASLIQGGTELSTYPDSCKLQIERRMIPGETRADVDTELYSMLDSLRLEDPKFKANHRIFFLRDPMEVSTNERICQVLRGSIADTTGREPEFIGGGGWLDTQIISSHGTSAVAFGPKGFGAHAAVEYVELDSVFDAAKILERAIKGFCGTA